MDVVEMAIAQEFFDQEERERNKKKLIADLRCFLPQTGEETWNYFIKHNLANATSDEIAAIEREVNQK